MQHLNADNLIRAVDYFERATRIDPKHAEAWHNLGTARKRFGDLPATEKAGALNI